MISVLQSVADKEFVDSMNTRNISPNLGAWGEYVSWLTLLAQGVLLKVDMTMTSSMQSNRTLMETNKLLCDKLDQEIPWQTADEGSHFHAKIINFVVKQPSVPQTKEWLRSSWIHNQSFDEGLNLQAIKTLLRDTACQFQAQYHQTIVNGILATDPNKLNCGPRVFHI
jgi:hypothetical protein